MQQGQNKGEKTEEAEIKIIDIQTGRISEKSRWQKGVHQFLELKHDITVKKESLVPISLSHAVFYQMYQTITALTGTAEHAQTAQIYNLTTFHAPPHLPVQRKDLPTIFTETTEEHYTLILDNARNYLKLGRPLLILCETIEDSQDLTKLLELHKIESQLLNEIQEEQEELVITRAGLPGQITVATNTAGRGTDIILNFESLQNGGLHVLLTFYPDSEREKLQAIGRAGRQGQPGSSQMIINKESPKLKKILSSSDSPIDALLFSYWKEREAQQIKEHLSRAILERLLSEKTSIFFDAFRLWKTLVNQNTFLDRESQRLYKLKIATDKETEVLDHLLSKKERLLAKEYKELLFSNESSWIHWKAFLKRVIVQLDHKIMKEWSLQFFQPITEEIVTPNKEEVLIKTEIEEKFDNHRPNWEKYLTPDGQGIFVYLEELTGFKL